MQRPVKRHHPRPICILTHTHTKNPRDPLRAAQAYKALACHEDLIQLTNKKSNKRLLIIKGVGESNTYIVLLRDQKYPRTILHRIHNSNGKLTYGNKKEREKLQKIHDLHYLTLFTIIPGKILNKS